ncbi:MAG: helix-turn-helix domain-containing protein [Kineosporiaceae bacterium]|jgi:excisionase family DNA binding protein
MSGRVVETVRPAEADVTAAVAALPRVRDFLTSHPDSPLVQLRVDGSGDSEDADGEEVLTVPRGAVELLARVLAHMADGQGVSVVSSNAELTTQQAADLLNVSRPFLIGLLDAGQIDYRLVGTHRRIRAESLLAYLRSDDARRRQAADELTALNQEMGLL